MGDFSKWGFFCFVFPFWKELFKSQGLLQTKLTVQKTMILRERYLIFFGWTQSAHFLSVEISDQSLFLDLDSSNSFYHLWYLQVCPWDYFFFLPEIKGTNRGWKTNEVGKQCKSTWEWSLHQTLWGLILFLTFQSHRFFSNCCFLPASVAPISKNYEKHHLHVGAGLSRFITHSY